MTPPETPPETARGAPSLEFWFEFASTYSYLSVMRIEDRAAEMGVRVTWRPFLLGPIFAAQGWSTSPFNLQPSKGRYMWRDLERRAARHGLPYAPRAADDPRPFPQNGLIAARLTQVGLAEGWGVAFAKRVYVGQFAESADISEPGALSRWAAEAGAEGDALTRANMAENKDALRGAVERATALGVFGAPAFTVGDELFWGDDRLEDALEWARDQG